MKTSTKQIFSAVILAAGIASGLLGGGWFAAKAVYQAKAQDRFVTVKGLAERVVKSDLAIWQIKFREVGSNLIDTSNRIDHDKQVIAEFLKQNGFLDPEITLQAPKVKDQFANLEGQPNAANNLNNRYVITGEVKVVSTNVDQVDKVNRMLGELIKQNIPLTFDEFSGNPNPTYYYMALDQVRPAMMAEAIRSARDVAQQFAQNSGAEIGLIKHANQGVFQIMARDSSTLSNDWNSSQNALSAIDKRIRLVTTVDYFFKK